MLTLVSSLANGALNDSQCATVQTLRAAILALSEQEGQPETFAMPLARVPQAVWQTVSLGLD